MKEEYHKVINFLLGFLLTLLLLLVLGALHVNYPDFTSLEAHWVGLSLLPLLAYLWFGGYITSVNAFGLEFQNTLKSPIEDSLDLFRTVENASVFSIKDDSVARKTSRLELQRMSSSKKRKIKILKFDTTYHYNPSDVVLYLKSLPNLQFLEVMHADRHLVSIVPLSKIFLTEADSDYQRPYVTEETYLLDRAKAFLDYVHAFQDYPFVDPEVEKQFPDATLRIDKSLSVRNLLESVRVLNARVVAVENDDQECLGVITQEQLFRYFLGTVIDSK
ncbi:hypothetical protein [Roseibium sp. RKSG952]|uniref:hypothetical protein n=1 Tax=Roseibium sp. RKSG952 TaxID=2529384 RepID=UPI0012BD0C8C|nr:hypothetical protein [Roseibium sp. RKSG952]MTI03827.1 hypothetical protein [Roseibium sp. RKSG952]